MALPNDENVQYHILIDAKEAIKNLRDIMRHTEDNAEKIRLFSALVLDSAQRWGKSWQYALSVYKQLNAEFAKSHKATLFGRTGGQDLFGGTEKLLESTEQIRKAQDAVGAGAKKMGNDIESGGRHGARGIDVLRIALGTLVAMLLFNVIAAIQTAFRTMIDNLRETELAVYNLINAERRLSEEGIDVTPKGLQETIDAVRELVPILSQIQAEELVSRIATNVAPALKLTNDQIKQMAEATALLYVRNKALGKSFEEVESQLTNAFLTGKVSQGINNLGVKISDQIVRDEALRLGLVETADEFDNLSGEMEAQVKAAAMLSVVYKNATQDIQSLDEYMETTDATIESTKTTWNDLLTTVGTLFGPLLSQGLGVLKQQLEGFLAILQSLTPEIQKFVAFWVGAIAALKNVNDQLILGRGTFFNITEVINTFTEAGSKAYDSFQGLGEAVDTPTAAIEDLGDAIDELDLEGLRNKIEDIIEDTANAREDLAEKLSRKLEDLDEEYRRKAVDAETDYLRKVDDINRDYQNDLAKLRRKHREEDEKDEAKYQLALWELRMRFLMNLEDALHARDARQIIRLQKQYAIDKEALRRKHELENKEREQGQAEEAANLEEQRQRRLEDARIEYEQKLVDLNIAKQREQEDLQKWYEREQLDIEQAQQRKLETLLKGWVDEKKITEQNAAEVYAILAEYFGPGGLTDQLYQYMVQSMLANTIGAISQGMAAMGSLNSLYGLGQGVNPFAGSVNVQAPEGSLNFNQGLSNGVNPFTDQGFAEGGTLLATRPTRAVFGEGGPELVNFLPLNRVGKNVGKLFGDRPGGGINGQIRVLVDLSPDLEGRIVEKSMDGVADVISRVGRMKG